MVPSAQRDRERTRRERLIEPGADPHRIDRQAAVDGADQRVEHRGIETLHPAVLEREGAVAGQRADQRGRAATAAFRRHVERDAPGQHAVAGQQFGGVGICEPDMPARGEAIGAAAPPSTQPSCGRRRPRLRSTAGRDSVSSKRTTARTSRASSFGVSMARADLIVIRPVCRASGRLRTAPTARGRSRRRPGPACPKSPRARPARRAHQARIRHRSGCGCARPIVSRPATPMFATLPVISDSVTA